MSKKVLSVALISVLSLMAVGCQKDPSTTGGTPGSSTTEMWPTKKISHIVHSVGTFDYLTYDFTWEEDLLKEISCTIKQSPRVEKVPHISLITNKNK